MVICVILTPFPFYKNIIFYGDNSEAKFLLVFTSGKSRPKSRVPEPTSRLTSNQGSLVRMVDQNGSKFECLQKITKKLRFIQIEIFFHRSSLGEMQN